MTVTTSSADPPSPATALAGVLARSRAWHGADPQGGAEDRRSARGDEHAPRRLQRPAGAHRLSAHGVQAGRPLHRLYRPPRRQPASSPSRSTRSPAKPSSTAPRSSTSPIPRQPKYLAHIPGAVGDGEAGAAQMTRVCDGRSLGKGDPDKVYLLRAFGREGHEIWDVTDPAKPKVITRLAGHVGHPQELLGMRRRHRLSGLDAAGLAGPHGRRSTTSATRPIRSRFATSRWSGSSPARPARCRSPSTA